MNNISVGQMTLAEVASLVRVESRESESWKSAPVVWMERWILSSWKVLSMSCSPCDGLISTHTFMLFFLGNQS